MTAWFRRARQTRTQVDDPSAEHISRQKGALAAYRTLAVMQLCAQTMLGLTWYGFDALHQTVWQAAALLALPLCGLWALWRGAVKGLRAPAGKWILWLLVPCLMLDGMALLHAQGQLMAQLAPQYPHAARVLIVTLVVFVTVLLARENGVAYGANVLRWWVAALFLLSTIFLQADARTERLWPILGRGVGWTLTESLAAAGCTWGVALLFVTPPKKAQPANFAQKGDRSPWWLLAAWIVGIIWALSFATVQPWQSGDALMDGQRLMALARHSSVIFLTEMSGLLWLLVLPLALCGTAVGGVRILRMGVPKMPCSVATAAVLLPALICQLTCADALTGTLKWMLPWRIVLSAAAGAALWIVGRKGAKAGGKR